MTAEEDKRVEDLKLCLVEAIDKQKITKHWPDIIHAVMRLQVSLIRGMMDTVPDHLKTNYVIGLSQDYEDMTAVIRKVMADLEHR